jgi:hypothetical protein
MITTAAERRVNWRKRILKGAFISFSEKAPKLECTVRDYTSAGANLHVSTTFGLPHQFELVMNGIRRHCRAQWRTDNKIGVTFESP